MLLIFLVILRRKTNHALSCRGLTIKELTRFSEKKLKLAKHSLDDSADILEKLLNVHFPGVYNV